MSGSYIVNVVLDSDATVKIHVNVINVGSYKITTGAINGYSFSGAGTFSFTGNQTVVLKATGTPLKEETDFFTVNAGNDVCTFSTNVLTPVNVSGDDHFPLTSNSYWVYDDVINNNTFQKTVVDSTDLNNNTYEIVKEDIQYGGPYQFFYRKTGTDYFEYAAPNEYTTFFQYKKPVYADIPFLKENLSTGSSWQSPEYIDTTTDGSIITLQYNYSCINANATVTVNGNAFANVYEIKMLPSIKSAGQDYANTSENYLFYYAKGIGLIYLKKTLSNFIQQEIKIKNWKVN